MSDQGRGMEKSKPDQQGSVLQHLLNASRYTLAGLRVAWGELAFRQELLLGLILVPAAWLLALGVWASVLLNLLWLGVLVIELLNSSLEAVVDLASPEYHSLAKRAKDMGSAAVGLALLGNLFAWTAALLLRFK
ncbi:MAG: diacylglycerol kinase [Lentisphaeria bacterium]